VERSPLAESHPPPYWVFLPVIIEEMPDRKQDAGTIGFAVEFDTTLRIGAEKRTRRAGSSVRSSTGKSQSQQNRREGTGKVV
jgi:hypothetical protein